MKTNIYSFCYRSKIAVILFVILFLTLNEITFSQWVLKSNGIGTQKILSLVVKENKLFAGTQGNGIYVSTDLGESWTQTSLNTSMVRALYTDGQNIYAGTLGNSMYISHDDGATWVQTLTTVPRVTSFANDGNKIYAGTSFYGIHLSEDQGATWNRISFNLLYVGSILLRPGKMLATHEDFSGVGVYSSTDGGVMWNQTSLNIHSQGLVENGNRIFAGTLDSGMYLSDDNGDTWVHTSLSTQNVIGIFVFEDYIFAGIFNGGLYVSHNNGMNWEPKNGGLPANISVDGIAKQQKYIFLATLSGVYRSHLNDILSIQPISNQIPNQYSLSQNYPNPFNPSTKITFDIPPGSSVAQTFLSVYDMLGREVAVLVNEELNSGTYEVEWNASNYPSGIYFYRLSAGDFNQTKKMLLIK